MGKGVLGATTEDFAAFASKGQELLANLQMEMNEPLEHREMRMFRMKEVLELSGLKPYHWRKWLDKKMPEANSNEVRLTLEQVHEFMKFWKKLPTRKPGSKAMRMVVATLKGGATKTSTTLHLGHALAIRGYRVLMIDGDPQGTLTTLAGYRSEAIQPEETLAAVFDRIDSPDLFPMDALKPKKTHIHGLDFIPACLAMINTDFLVASAFRSNSQHASRFYTILDDALKLIEDDYDIVLMDTSPSFSYTAMAIMWAAHSLIVPMPPNLPDYRATVDFCDMFSDILASIEKAAGVQRTWNPVAVVHTRTDHTPTTAMVRSFSTQTFGPIRIEESVPFSQAIVSATSRFRSIYELGGGEVRRVRDALDALCSRLMTEVHQVWEDQAEMAKEQGTEVEVPTGVTV
jgi:chromosome partitioning protein